MQTFPVGTDAILSVPYAKEDGTAVTPTAVSYSVLDGDGNILEGPLAIAGPFGSATDITVPAIYNATTGARSILLNMTTASGTVLAETVFGIVSQTSLVFLKNSLQTYSQAMFTANGLLNIDSFAAADKGTQTLALIEGFRRLTLMNYVIPWPEVVDVMNYLYPRYAWEITPRMWPMMTAELYARYPVEFQAAMQKAQVAEANAILTTDPIGDYARAGLLAWTVGESKMMLKSGLAPFRGTLDKATMKYLQGWVDNRYTLTRS